MKKIVVYILLVCFVFSVQARKWEEECIAGFEKEIQSFRQEMENVGLSVVFVKDSKIVYTKQFGVKNLQTHDPVRENTMFRRASIS